MRTAFIIQNLTMKICKRRQLPRRGYERIRGTGHVNPTPGIDPGNPTPGTDHHNQFQGSRTRDHQRTPHQNFRRANLGRKRTRKPDHQLAVKSQLLFIGCKILIINSYTLISLMLLGFCTAIKCPYFRPKTL